MSAVNAGMRPCSTTFPAHAKYGGCIVRGIASTHSPCGGKLLLLLGERSFRCRACAREFLVHFHESEVWPKCSHVTVASIQCCEHSIQ